MRRLTRHIKHAALGLALCFSACSTSGCAAALPYISAAIPIAERALDWIAQVERHVALVDDVDEGLADGVRTAIPVTRASALAVRDCGMRAKGDQAKTVDCASALADLEQQLEHLFKLGRPFGVLPVRQPGLLGAPPDGVGILGVPSPCEIVYGATAARCQAKAMRPAEGTAL